MKALITTFIFLTVSFVVEAARTSGAAKDDTGVYIVYMGSPLSADGSFKNDRTQILSSLIEQ